MIVVKPSYKIHNDFSWYMQDMPFLLEHGVRLLQKIEYMARISHRSEEAQTDVSWDRFLRGVVFSHVDWSVV